MKYEEWMKHFDYTKRLQHGKQDIFQERRRIRMMEEYPGRWRQWLPIIGTYSRMSALVRGFPTIDERYVHKGEWVGDKCQDLINAYCKINDLGTLVATLYGVGKLLEHIAK